jgi:putative transposase
LLERLKERGSIPVTHDPIHISFEKWQPAERMMSRLPRVVVPGYPHHIVQRGNRRQQVFFRDQDRRLYLRLLGKYGTAAGIAFWAYCLMDNHVHLIAVPKHVDSFSKGLGKAHWKYTMTINLREDWRGFLWQGRFFSCPLDQPQLLMATKYALFNPVRAGLVEKPEDYRWSSARAHLGEAGDTLISGGDLNAEIVNWRGFLSVSPSESDLKPIRDHTNTGRPLGTETFIHQLEMITGRVLRPQKRGPKPWTF